jgi:hypothetical protein
MKKQVCSLCEAVSGITYIPAKENYLTDDSREMISQFVHWAEEFERLHKHIEWGINSPLDYWDSIYYFTLFKINQWQSI